MELKEQLNREMQDCRKVGYNGEAMISYGTIYLLLFPKKELVLIPQMLVNNCVDINKTTIDMKKKEGNIEIEEGIEFKIKLSEKSYIVRCLPVTE